MNELTSWANELKRAKQARLKQVKLTSPRRA
jgi:hypothetical protein